MEKGAKSWFLLFFYFEVIPQLFPLFQTNRYTGAKAIGTAWTIAPSEEEESIWGGKTLTKGNCTLFNKLTIVKLSMTMRVFIMHVFM